VVLLILKRITVKAIFQNKEYTLFKQKLWPLTLKHFNVSQIKLYNYLQVIFNYIFCGLFIKIGSANQVQNSL
jgi:hypothetical protein